MKKFFTLIAGVIMVMAMTACSKSLEEKSRDGELKAEDYGEMVDYIYEAMEEFQEINESIDPSDRETAKELIGEVVAEYPDVSTYFVICMNAFENEDPEFQKGADASKMARILDCSGRGWINFW